MEARERRSRRSTKLKWELDARPLISTKLWLKNYGLKKNKLDMHQLLPTIGFKLSDDYVTNLKRPVASRYGGSLFKRAFRKDGNTYNLKCSRDKLVQIQNRLSQVMHLFDRRLAWLTSESRRTFGVVEEKCATVVLDIKNMSPQQFNQFIGAFQLVLEEQISQISKFNLIRSAENMKLFREECVPVTHDTIYEAIQWIKGFDRLEPVSSTAACEAVLHALEDKANEAVYLLTEGNSIDACRGVLIEKLSSSHHQIPIHVVSYNCDNIDTIHYLKELAKSASGRFHAYAVTMEMLTYDADNVQGSDLMLKKNMYGGMPEGAGVREDVLKLFEEFEEARNNLEFIKELISECELDAPKEDANKSKNHRGRNRGQVAPKKESSMGSKEWLKRYGLEACKLGFCDALSKVTFDHVEGVTNIYNTTNCADKKLVDAIYCENLFPAVHWTDGTIKHVIVTPGIHRSYEQKMTVALNKIQERINWLQKGSRTLFGTIIEDSIYIIVDCSASMEPHLKFVKEKLHALINEQLRHKKQLNIVSYGTTVQAWSSRLVDIKPPTLQSAWNWIKALTCSGSTNTYGALQHAISDEKTEAIYLLTDGCPDQPPKSIISQVLMQNKLPIHTIAFNCNNTEGNEFLYELACATGGRFHHFSEFYMDPSQPQPWVSEDLKLLKAEYERGKKNLEKISKLRDQCQAVYWENGIKALQQGKTCKTPNGHPKVHASRINSTTASSASTSFPFVTVMRPSSAPPPIKHEPKPPSRSRSIKRRKSKLKNRCSKSSNVSRSKSVSESVAESNQDASESYQENVSSFVQDNNSVTLSENVSQTENVGEEEDTVSTSNAEPNFALLASEM